MAIQQNVPLAPLTAFGLGGPAAYFVSIEKESDITEALQFSRDNNLDIFVFGGGSNMVVSDRGFNGMVLSIDNKGIDIINETDDHAYIKVGSGEIWDNVVAFAVERNWWGIETMSYIPGKTGAFSVQNVGAYGSEASEVVERVTVFDREDQTLKELSNADCEFTYRNSLFKTNAKGRYIILETVLKLSKKPQPNTEYVDVKNYFADHNITDPTIQQIREAIISIRQKKFADPAKVGTAGSFFLNLYISQDEYAAMHKKVMEVYGEEKAGLLEEIKNKFPVDAGIKIPTAFIIDRICELKGTRVGGAIVSETQALAIINPEKNATSDDVLALIQKVRQAVYDATTIKLDVEPELVGFTNQELDAMRSIS